MNSDTQELRIQTACLMVVAAVAIGAALYWLRPVLLPFVLSIFLVVGLAPVLDLIEKRLRAPRLVAVAIAFLLGILLLALLWFFVWVSVASLLENVDDYHQRLEQLIHRAAAYLPLEGPAAGGGETPTGAEDGPRDRQEADAAEDRAVGRYIAHQARQMAGRLAAALTDLLASSTMVLIFMFFLLLGGSSSAVPRSGVWRDIEAKIRGYIVTKTVISVFTGAAFGLVLWLFGIPLALVFGLLAFLLNYIPNIGPVIASLLPLPLIVLHPELSMPGMIAAIAVSGGVQFTSGNIIEPKIMGESFELHPVAILVTLMFWGVIWGIVGMFLAVPITAAVNILMERFERTRPIADVIAGRLDALRDVLGEEK